MATAGWGNHTCSSWHRPSDSRVMMRQSEAQAVLGGLRPPRVGPWQDPQDEAGLAAPLSGGDGEGDGGVVRGSTWRRSAWLGQGAQTQALRRQPDHCQLPSPMQTGQPPAIPPISLDPLVRRVQESTTEPSRHTKSAGPGPLGPSVGFFVRTKSVDVGPTGHLLAIRPRFVAKGQRVHTRRCR